MDDDAPQPLRRHCTQHLTLPTRAEYCYHLSDANTITAGIDCYDEDSTFGDLTSARRPKEPEMLTFMPKRGVNRSRVCRALSGFSEMTRVLSHLGPEGRFLGVKRLCLDRL
ncbi:hypothetical protein M3484_05650 [Pseudomonas sp. GX19020]|uniref:hypothetical protein n=1 Tax=Pseudomonas sp. GX19020 TaxID=2942277 RepID=UPI002019BFA1|nr:hypothetical protein [Pseudomonas sp. GX19020]MCL4066047.1 hypothetical protein [Pseudomonas sp. GX19020]